MSQTTQRITARGHEHVSATHESTLELTTDDWLTPAGDCIIGIAADVAPSEFEASVATAAKHRDAELTLELSAGTVHQTITGRGDPELTFDDDRSLVVRTSTYVDDRTVMVEADRAAADLDREFVTALQDGTPLEATLSVSRP